MFEIKCFQDSISNTRHTLKTNFSELIPAYQYLLEWHYNFLQFEQLGGHSVIRQHGSALVALIGCKAFSSTPNAFTDRLNQCISKWFYTATHQKVRDVSEMIKKNRVELVDFNKKKIRFSILVLSNHLIIHIPCHLISPAWIRSLGLHPAVPNTISEFRLLQTNLHRFKVRIL